MAAIAAAQLVKLIIGLTISGNRLSFMLHYAADNTLAGNILDQFCNAWETACLADLKDCLSEECKIESLIAYCVDPNTVVPGTNYLSGQIGSISEESLPSNVGAVVQLRQTEISSKHNGRFVLPGIPETVCVDSLLTEAFCTATMAPFLSSIKGPINESGIDFSLAVVVRQDGGVPVVPTGRLVTNLTAVRNMGTQRRRTTELREFHP